MRSAAGDGTTVLFSAICANFMGLTQWRTYSDVTEGQCSALWLQAAPL